MLVYSRMKTGGEHEFSVPPKRRTRAFTRAELIAIIAVIAFTALLMLPALFVHNPQQSIRITCISNLAQVGLAFRVWEGDNNDKFPTAYIGDTNYTLPFPDATNAFRYFQSMSNELSNPLVLICPEDKKHHGATNFDTDFSNKRVSYFVGLDATDEKFPQLFLAGDTHITNGLPLKNGILELLTNHLAGWTMERHGGVGNVAMADGSVQQFNSAALRMANQNAGPKTNRLLMPR